MKRAMALGAAAVAIVAMVVWISFHEWRADSAGDNPGSARDTPAESLAVALPKSAELDAELDAIVEEIARRRQLGEEADDRYFKEDEVEMLDHFISENEGTEAALTARVVRAVLLVNYGRYADYKRAELAVSDFRGKYPGTWQEAVGDLLQLRIDDSSKPRMEGVPHLAPEVVLAVLQKCLPYAREMDQIDTPTMRFIRESHVPTFRGNYEAMLYVNIAYRYRDMGAIDKAIGQLHEALERFTDPGIVELCYRKLEDLEQMPAPVEGERPDAVEPDDFVPVDRETILKAQSAPNRRFDPRMLLDPLFELDQSEETVAKNEPVEQPAPPADEAKTDDVAQVEVPTESNQGSRHVAAIIGACVALAAVVGVVLYRKSSRA